MDLGLSNISEEVIAQFVEGANKIKIDSKWNSWLANYDKNLPNTVP